MKVIGYDIETSLTVKDQADLFSVTATGLYDGKAKLAAGVRRLFNQMPDAQKLEFYTPKDESPFATLDESPGFSVGVSFPKAAGTGGGTVDIQLFVSDRGSQRESSLRAPSSFGGAGATRKMLDDFASAFQRADPGAKIGEPR